TLIALAQIGVFHLGVKGADLAEDQLWAWCKQALTPPADSAKPKPKAVAAKTPAKRSTARRPRKLTG
ncbi:MAG TPA: TetR/AcrR family transcriptional regulator, partial [Mycobacterium sp.]|nr:TetR/AcrR family transcriptional regulator [Mycobacterium sp.]